MKPKYINVIHPSGYPITMMVESDDPKIAELIKQLNSWGFRPDSSGDTWLRTPEGLPICSRHGAVMNKREKQGDTWFSHSVIDSHGEKHFCRGYKSPSSPGWDIVDARSNGNDSQSSDDPEPDPIFDEPPPDFPEEIEDDLF